MTSQEFEQYIIEVLGYDSNKITTVRRAIEITEQAIYKRKRWGFLRREGSFNSVANTKTYDLQAKLGGGDIDDRFVQVKIGTKILEPLEPQELDRLRDQNVSSTTESVLNDVSTFCIRNRNSQGNPIIELDTTPANASLTIYVIYYKTGDSAYLLKKWSSVLMAGVRACLQPRRTIQTESGSVTTSEILGQPDGDPIFEKALYEMMNNEMLIPYKKRIEIDPQAVDAMDSIYNAD